MKKRFVVLLSISTLLHVVPSFPEMTVTTRFSIDGERIPWSDRQALIASAGIGFGVGGVVFLGMNRTSLHRMLVGALWGNLSAGAVEFGTAGVCLLVSYLVSNNYGFGTWTSEGYLDSGGAILGGQVRDPALLNELRSLDDRSEVTVFRGLFLDRGSDGLLEALDRLEEDLACAKLYLRSINKDSLGEMQLELLKESRRKLFEFFEKIDRARDFAGKEKIASEVKAIAEGSVEDRELYDFLQGADRPDVTFLVDATRRFPLLDAFDRLESFSAQVRLVHAKLGQCPEEERASYGKAVEDLVQKSQTLADRIRSDQDYEQELEARLRGLQTETAWQDAQNRMVDLRNQQRDLEKEIEKARAAREQSESEKVQFARDRAQLQMNLQDETTKTANAQMESARAKNGLLQTQCDLEVQRQRAAEATALTEEQQKRLTTVEERSKNIEQRIGEIEKTTLNLAAEVGAMRNGQLPATNPEFG